VVRPENEGEVSPHFDESDNLLSFMHRVIPLYEYPDGIVQHLQVAKTLLRLVSTDVRGCVAFIGHGRVCAVAVLLDVKPAMRTHTEQQGFLWCFGDVLPVEGVSAPDYTPPAFFKNGSQQQPQFLSAGSQLILDQWLANNSWPSHEAKELADIQVGHIEHCPSPVAELETLDTTSGEAPVGALDALSVPESPLFLEQMSPDKKEAGDERPIGEAPAATIEAPVADQRVEMAVTAGTVEATTGGTEATAGTVEAIARGAEATDGLEVEGSQFEDVGIEEVATEGLGAGCLSTNPQALQMLLF
jgi:hypothetical protein